MIDKTVIIEFGDCKLDFDRLENELKDLQKRKSNYLDKLKEVYITEFWIEGLKKLDGLMRLKRLEFDILEKRIKNLEKMVEKMPLCDEEDEDTKCINKRKKRKKSYKEKNKKKKLCKGNNKRRSSQRIKLINEK